MSTWAQTTHEKAAAVGVSGGLAETKVSAAEKDVTSGAAYLRHVEELQHEIEDAMRAISGNQLGILEESLWRQQVLCTGLKHLSQSLAAEDAGGPLMQRVREASVRLSEVNRAYGYLVQQSAGSADLLLRLMRSYRDEGGMNTGGSRPSWGCEA